MNTMQLIQQIRKYLFELFKTQNTYVLVLYTVCLFLFFLFQQFWIAFALLVLLGIFTRFSDVIKVQLNKEGLNAEFIDRKVQEIKQREDSVKESMEKAHLPIEDQEKMQELVDEVFRLGYVVGGGKIHGMMNNVRIDRDDEGNIVTVGYDEIYS